MEISSTLEGVPDLASQTRYSCSYRYKLWSFISRAEFSSSPFARLLLSNGKKWDNVNNGCRFCCHSNKKLVQNKAKKARCIIFSLPVQSELGPHVVSTHTTTIHHGLLGVETFLRCSRDRRLCTSNGSIVSRTVWVHGTAAPIKYQTI